MDKIFILEGVEGSGKTTYAKKLLDDYKGDSIVNYVKFPKTAGLFYWKQLLSSVKMLDGIVVMERSLVSKYIYSGIVDRYDLLVMLKFTLDKDKVEFLYFSKPYVKKEGVDYEKLMKIYDKIMGFIKLYFNVTYVS